MSEVLNENPQIVELNNGVQFLFTLSNGYGASVIRHSYSYGSAAGLFEFAVLKDGKLNYDTGITDDVIGSLTFFEAMKLVQDVEKLDDTFTIADPFYV